MVSYRVRLRRSAAKELRKLPPHTRKTVVLKIKQLSTQPRPAGVEKLKNFENLYRIRSGMYRVVYEINDGTVIITVIKVGHRKDVYRKS